MSKTPAKPKATKTAAKATAPAAKKTAAPKKPKVPRGLHVLSPHLVCRGASDAIDFYKKAFGATEMTRMPGPDGKLMHGCIAVGGSTVFLVDENLQYGMRSPQTLKGSPVTIHLFVADVDAFVAKAVKAGATVKMEVADQFWGDRYGVIEDPFGHSWAIATHVKQLSPAEMQANLKKMMASMG